MLTAFYSFRLISRTFFTKSNATKNDYQNTHEQITLLVLPYVVLSLFEILLGYIAKDMFVEFG